MAKPKNVPFFYSSEEYRDQEYPQLRDKTYLDNGGTTLYAKSLVDEFAADLTSNLYGNPHSTMTPSALADERVEAVRLRALRFFGASPDHWDLVFTANATASIKLVTECLRDYAHARRSRFFYGHHRDAHTSLVGGREFTKDNKCFTSDSEVDSWIAQNCPLGIWRSRVGLFAYPGQSNMTGRRLPKSWPERIRSCCTTDKVYTLLDAAALASTAKLDLSDPSKAPDFVALSFYKIFGFPNIGALLVQKQSQHVLSHRRFFGGGTVDMVISVDGTWHTKKNGPIHRQLEEGTLPFTSIFALDHAINVHDRLYGPDPMRNISAHTSRLIKILYDELAALKYDNGLGAVHIYNEDAARYGDSEAQGATIALNVRRADGTFFGYDNVERMADKEDIYVRSGSLCNPGGTATYLGFSAQEMKAAYVHGHRCSNPMQFVNGKPTGVVRVSLGAMSAEGDIMRFVEFIKTKLMADTAATVTNKTKQQPQQQQQQRYPHRKNHSMQQVRNGTVENHQLEKRMRRRTVDERKLGGREEGERGEGEREEEEEEEAESESSNSNNNTVVVVTLPSIKKWIQSTIRLSGSDFNTTKTQSKVQATELNHVNDRQTQITIQT